MKKAHTVRRGVVTILMLSAALTGSHDVSAQTEGVALDNYDAAERGSDWFWADSLDLRGNRRPAAGVTMDWAYKPLVAYDEAGDELGAPIENQLFFHAGVSWVVVERLRLALNLPLLAYQGGQSIGSGDDGFAAPSGAAFGDVRLAADLRLFGAYREPLSVSLGLGVHVPTGNQDAFTSDGAARVSPRVHLAGESGMVAYAVRLGATLRATTEDSAALSTGHQINYGVAGGLRLVDGALLVGPEIWATTILSDGNNEAFSGSTTLVEGLLGAHYLLAETWKLGLGVGMALSQGAGAPQTRTLLSAEWAPRP